MMGRKRKFILTTSMSIVNQFVTVVYGFVLPIYFLQSYGSAVNGLISSIAHFLGFISFMEMGMGLVVQSSLYKPLEDRDYNSISKIYLASEHFFRNVATVFAGYTLVLFFVYPIFVNNSFDFVFTASLIVIMSIDTLAQYYLGISFQILLAADQRTYIIYGVNSLALAANTIIGVLLIKSGAEIHIVKLMSAVLFAVRQLVFVFYARRHYRIDRDVKYTDDCIQQKWNGLAYHLSELIVVNGGVILLTVFSSLESVSVYAIYYLIVGGIGRIFRSLMNGIPALFGNIVARKEWSILYDTYTIFEWIIHTTITCFFSIASILVVPFVLIYTKGVVDTDYNVPVFAIILTVAEGLRCLREYCIGVISAAGHYKQTQNGAFLQIAIYFIVSVSLVKFYGIIGVAIGLLVAIGFYILFFIWYMRKNILKRSIYYFLRHCVIDCFVVVIIYVITKEFGFVVSSASYIEWLCSATKIGIVGVLTSMIIQLILNWNYIDGFARLLLQKGFAANYRK